MYHVKTNEPPCLEIVDNNIVVSTHISSARNEESNDFLFELSQDYINEEGETAIQTSFKLSELLEHEIEGYELVNEKEEEILDIESKPLFDKIKEELLELIDRIDVLKYK